MISDIFADLLSWQFVVGLALGFSLHRCYAHVKAGWLNRRRPLPGGLKRHADGVNSSWLTRVLAAGIIVYSLVQVQATAHRTDVIINDARTFSAEVQECQRQFNGALRARAAITTENDYLSQVQRTALADWLHDLLFPPPEVVKLDRTGPAYNQWALNLTQRYYGIIADAQAKQDENNRERAAHPLPEPTCGHS
jgi:hypothetical protein